MFTLYISIPISIYNAYPCHNHTHNFCYTHGAGQIRLRNHSPLHRHSGHSAVRPQSSAMLVVTCPPPPGPPAHTFACIMLAGAGSGLQATCRNRGLIVAPPPVWVRMRLRLEGDCRRTCMWCVGPMRPLSVSCGQMLGGGGHMTANIAFFCGPTAEWPERLWRELSCCNRNCGHSCMHDPADMALQTRRWQWH